MPCKCASCGKFLPTSPKGVATCASCHCTFHKGCVGTSHNVKRDWVCSECKKKKRQIVCDAGLVRDPDTSPAVAVDILVPGTARPSSSEVSEIKELRRELIQYMSESRDFRSEFRTFMVSTNDRLSGLERRIEALETREPPASPCSDDITLLQQQIIDLKSEVNDRDQDALLADLDIGHLPEVKGENIINTVTVVAAKLGVALEARDVVFAERVGVSANTPSNDEGARGGGAGGQAQMGGRPRRVIVRLARRSLRDDLLNAARVRRCLSSADIGFPGHPRRVYINERLTRTNRQLFHKVREECRKKSWRYSWSKKGRIFARQTDGKPIYSIRSELDLARVFGADVVLAAE